MMNLTEMEKMFLNGMRDNEYNDALDGPTWTFSAVDYSGLEGRQARGVISSLVKKDLIWVDNASDDESAIGFTELGKKLFDNSDGEECEWGGPRLLKL